MPLRQRIVPYETDFCDFIARWMIHPRLGQALFIMAATLPFPISMISGHRTPERQQELSDAGRPAADPQLSTHLSCPAGGADVWPGVAVTDAVKAELGAAGVRAGLRWGGGSPVDPRTGIPSDWNHFDLGPRSTYTWQA